MICFNLIDVVLDRGLRVRIMIQSSRSGTEVESILEAAQVREWQQRIGLGDLHENATRRIQQERRIARGDAWDAAENCVDLVDPISRATIIAFIW
jgi:hypothetical protein